jgi:hypothetical protein
MTTGVGIDVSKPWLDVARSTGNRTFRVANTPVGWKALVQAVADDPDVRIVLEASGGYEQGVLDYLVQAAQRADPARLGTATIGIVTGPTGPNQPGHPCTAQDAAGRPRTGADQGRRTGLTQHAGGISPGTGSAGSTGYSQIDRRRSTQRR